MKRQNQVKKTTYAQSTQVRVIRKKMMDIMRREVQTSDIRQIVAKLLPDSIATDITKAAASTYPLHEVHVRKVKVLRSPNSTCPNFWKCTASLARSSREAPRTVRSLI